MDPLPLHSPAHLKSLRKTRGLTQAQLAKRGDQRLRIRFAGEAA